ncbi:MAG TPA: FAD-dependent oxidoreductase [Nevskiaceae bacterium]|nr:FAD-dependent oxidoreductase [Nevskiaceae bacterium]
MALTEQYDHLVIGGGAYGAMVATSIAESYPHSSVLLAEKEPDLFARATTNNHGRLHWGYQYPLHPQTAIQSRNNVTEFLSEYGDCVNQDVTSYYAIHKDSRVSVGQYEMFCKDANLPYERDDRPDIFGPDVLAAYRTDELTFSNSSLQRLFRNRLADGNVEVKTNCEIGSIHPTSNGILAVTGDEQVLSARNIFNCTYAGINEVHERSGIPLIPSTHEKYALFKIGLPEALRNITATVIYGAFASIVSNNEVGTHVLAHVKYSNCAKAIDLAPKDTISAKEIVRRYQDTLADSASFLPVLQDAEYRGEFVEVKSVFGVDPTEGERRVLTFPDYGGIPNYHVIFGGKMNSFYDASAFALSTLARR